MLNSRILIVGYRSFSSAVSPTTTIVIMFDMDFTSAATDVPRKFFSYGYYTNTGNGNHMDYKFGETFYIDTTLDSVTPTSGVIDFAGAKA